ncbi:uncharacterized protein C8R40DRAFT_1168966 [Lentinula edodes]|uniref:uncharacterized protein n=1 Tax=Lentinula edodes TaxID=5353 RepID=UPI001E8D3688|nr:uncharacterized protein C8R40DRAFT_1168966 [Lentinula edodes]KAH7877040.1 hypothetical protein C8R40DRAFT_1168966 [Lentinula edodes]
MSSGNRNICLSIAGHSVLGKPGVYEQPMFVKGGYQQPPLPLNIICKDAPTATHLYSVLLPVVERIYKLNPEKFDIKKSVNSNEFQEVACELDGDDCLKWAVKLRKYVGVFLSGLEALASIDLSKNSRFKQAFAFNSFEDAVAFQMGTSDNPTNAAWEYSPLQQPHAAEIIRQQITPTSPPDPPASIPPPTPSPPPTPKSSSKSFVVLSSPTKSSSTPPTPRTPSRRQVPQRNKTTAGGIINNININSSSPGPSRRSQFHSGAYWGLRLMGALKLSDGDAAQVEERLQVSTSKEDFVEACRRFPELTEALAQFLWDIHTKL